MDELFCGEGCLEGNTMRKKKVAVILLSLPQDGGGHQYAFLMMECLKEMQNKYEIVAICGNWFWRSWCRKNKIRCLEEKIPDTTENQMQFNRIFPYLAKIYNTYLTPMGKALKKEKVDILLSTVQIYFIPNYDVRIISIVHDLMHRYEKRFSEVGSEFKHREMILKSMVPYEDCVLTDSELGIKQFRESYLNRNTKKPQIISLPFTVPEHIQDRQEEYIKLPCKYVFYPAQFWTHKNHINLVKAIQLLKESIEDIHLVLVGSEKNCLKSIKKYIDENDLERNITILGFVSDGSITYLYTHAVAMIMPSYFGPTNIPPLEAMALGCPVAVSNKYAMPEQVGDAGLLFDPDSPEEIAECMKKLWLDETMRESLIEKGYQQVARWGKKEFCKKLDNILDRV